MKKILRISLWTFGIILLLSMAWVTLVLYSFSGTGRPVSKQIYSPDGSRVVVATVSVNKNEDAYLLVHLEIKDTDSGRTLFRELTRASDRLRWSVEWIDNNGIRLNSADIGPHCWAEYDEEWAETECP